MSVADDAAFMVNLVNDYLEDAQAHLDTMQTAAAAEDTALLERTAHSLKSTSETMGALALADVCRTIEQHTSTGAWQDAVEHIPAARHEFEAVKSTLLAQQAQLQAR